MVTTMRRVYSLVLMLGTWGCSGDAESTSQVAESDGAGAAVSSSAWRDTVEKILGVEGLERHAAACDFLSSRGVIARLYSVPDESITYRPMKIRSIPHAYCGANWPKANKVELEDAYSKAMVDYSQRKARAMIAREKFDEPMPEHIPGDIGISITIGSPMFDSSEEAIETLKSNRKTLANGVDVEVLGETRTVKMDDIEEWIDDIGDGATWSPKGNGLSVVYEGVILTVTANGFGDDQEDRTRARELAGDIISGS